MNTHYRSCVWHVINQGDHNIDIKKLYSRVLLEYLLSKDLPVKEIFHPNHKTDGDPKKLERIKPHDPDYERAVPNSEFAAEGRRKAVEFIYRECVYGVIDEEDHNIDIKKIYSRVLLEYLLSKDLPVKEIFHPNHTTDGDPEKLARISPVKRIRIIRDNTCSPSYIIRRRQMRLLDED